MNILWRMIAASLLILACGLHAEEPTPPDAGENTEQPAAAQPDKPAPKDDKAGDKSDVFKPREEISEDYPVPLPADI